MPRSERSSTTCAGAATLRCSSTRLRSIAFARERVSDLEIPRGELARAYESLPSAQRDALATAAARIRVYHEQQKAPDWSIREPDGTELGQRVTPIDRVGLYVPGGKAAYPSSVLMNAIPAQVAGVRDIVVVVPTPDGVRNPLVLAAAHLAGRHACLHDRRRAGHRSARLRHADRSPPSTRSAVRATPTSRRRSAACSAPSASTWWPASPRSW